MGTSHTAGRTPGPQRLVSVGSVVLAFGMFFWLTGFIGEDSPEFIGAASLRGARGFALAQIGLLTLVCGLLALALRPHRAPAIENDPVAPTQATGR